MARDGVRPKDSQDSPEVLCVEDLQPGDFALCPLPAFRAISWRGHHTALVHLQLGFGAVLRGLPQVVEHSEGVSDLVETVVEVTPCSSIIPYRAARERELLRCCQVFSVNMNWFRVGNLQQHHFCILLADLQVNLLCVGCTEIVLSRGFFVLERLDGCSDLFLGD